MYQPQDDHVGSPGEKSRPAALRLTQLWKFVLEKTSSVRCNLPLQSDTHKFYDRNTKILNISVLLTTEERGKILKSQYFIILDNVHYFEFSAITICNFYSQPIYQQNQFFTNNLNPSTEMETCCTERLHEFAW